MTEKDPYNIPAHTPGAKMDDGKIAVMQGALQYFPRALAAVAEVSQHGASKYTWMGWRSVPDGINRYSNALGRHLLYEAISACDDDSGLLHAAHAAWNALARLELIICKIVDEKNHGA